MLPTCAQPGPYSMKEPGLPVLAVLLSMSFSIHSRVRPTSYTELPSAPLSDMKKMKVLSSSPLALR